jgi:primary-amine oxidase
MRHDLFKPLTAEEITATAGLIRAVPQFAGHRIGFSAVFTEEPDKLALREGRPVARRARAARPSTSASTSTPPRCRR